MASGSVAVGRHGRTATAGRWPRMRILAFVLGLELVGGWEIAELREPVPVVPAGPVFVASRPLAPSPAAHLPDDIPQPAQVHGVGPIKPYLFEGRVVGWTTTGRVGRTDVGSAVRAFTAELAAAGWTTQPAGPADAFAVRHAAESWNLVKAQVDCPVQALECEMTILFATRGG